MIDNKRRALQLFGDALDLAPEARASFLDAACDGDPELRGVVDALLADNERLGSSLLTHSPLAQSEFAADLIATEKPPLPPDTKLGRYTLLNQLGAGGMGAVYRGRDEVLDRDVAVKIVSPDLLASGDAVRRFRREALALAKLNHAHIAAVYDVGQQDGANYLVMECVPGESLAERLARGPVPLTEAATLLLQIAEALEEAHERGVVHRDLKPANIMVTPKGQVKVLDFGIAKLLESPGTDATVTSLQTRGLLGTPLYMSPEQINEGVVDHRTDLWSLGVVFYQLLTGEPPFQASTNLGLLRAILENPIQPARQLRPELPATAEAIISCALEKDVAKRYQSASQMIRDASELVAALRTPPSPAQRLGRPAMRVLLGAAAVFLLIVSTVGYWLYVRISHQRWAREEAPSQVADLFAANRAVPGFLLLQKAEGYLPHDAHLMQLAGENTQVSRITSSPAGAEVRIQDYATPNGPWLSLGSTPLNAARLPNGYFRWHVQQPTREALEVALETGPAMDFALDRSRESPAGMVFDPGGPWSEFIGFIGWLGPYNLPPTYVDRDEVTNRQFQDFVDHGGYSNPRFWQQALAENGSRIAWVDLVGPFRDTTGRPGPATWAGGHFPEGKADFPVAGVSWFEASAFAAYAGKDLPVVAQWYQAAPPDVASSIVPVSNIARNGAPAAVGTFLGLGPYGTRDMAGNLREWVRNPVEGNLRYILGGSWKSPSYMYFTPEAASPFDRSELNGFRCVRNLAPVPAAAQTLIKPTRRDFSNFKPASDQVFHAYELLYAYPNAPLNAKSEGVIAETVDWREEKVSYDTAYGGERMSAYLFLPKKVRPPYQTVLFFPSARVEFLRDNDGGRKLGDVEFFDYVVQSGRAVLYPIYEDTYERRIKFFLPSAAQSIELTTDWLKDAARSLDYLNTRPDIDNSRLAYLGVSMGAATGVITTTILQDRLKTAVFLDGGYFLDRPSPGGDQAEFALRMKKPVLMVNGRYDYTFSVEQAQNPMFNMLGTPAKDKQHILLDTPHDVTQQRPVLIRVVLAWLDRYLGPVHE